MCIRIAFLLLIVLVAITTNPVHALSETEYKQNFENCSLNLAAENCDRDQLTPADYSKAVANYTARSRQGLVKSNGRKEPSSTRRTRSSSASPSAASNPTYHSSNQPGASAAVLPQSSHGKYRGEFKEESTEKELIYSLVIGLVLISVGIGVLYIIILMLKKAGMLLTRLKGSNPQIVLPGREEYISNKLSTGRAPVLLSRFFYICLIGTAISLLFDSYGYFIFLRFCYFATLLYCAQLNYIFGRGLLSGVCVAAAVLFNPFWPVYLYVRVPWLIIDSVALICIYQFVDTVKKTYQDSDISSSLQPTVSKGLELLSEEKLNEHVAKEIESDNIREGVWMKAASSAKTDAYEDVYREYIRLRVESLRADCRLFDQFLDDVYDAEVEDGRENDDSWGDIFLNLLYRATLGLIIIGFILLLSWIVLTH